MLDGSPEPGDDIGHMLDGSPEPGDDIGHMLDESPEPDVSTSGLNCIADERSPAASRCSTVGALDLGDFWHAELV